MVRGLSGKLSANDFKVDTALLDEAQKQRCRLVIHQSVNKGYYSTSFH